MSKVSDFGQGNSKKVTPLEPDTFYHVYNRSNGSEKIFLSDDNYTFFLKKYQLYIDPIADSFCYCLMPNHFHFLLRIKSEKELSSLPTFPKSSLDIPSFPKFKTLEKMVSKQFSNLFSSYTQAFNKQQSRMGSLFMKNFKRKKALDDKYLRKLVHYIHYNPVEAGLCYKPEDWKFSSFSSILSDEKTMIRKTDVIDWFEDRENFIYCHRHPPKEIGIERSAQEVNF